jgi:hypothetical protein
VILLSTAYFAPIQYYSKLVQDKQVVIERHEHYNKQSYRNRCTIYSANGLLDLAVPVVKSKEPKILITEVEIAYDTLWQKLHFKAIESAYRRSPFYGYYIDDLGVFFNSRHRYLYDFNMQIMRTVCRLAKIPFRATESQDYTKPGEGIIDLRNSIHPKIDRQETDPGFIPPRYTQVFTNKWGFKPNLSILDLLFNMGPETKDRL